MNPYKPLYETQVLCRMIRPLARLADPEPKSERASYVWGWGLGDVYRA